MRDVDDVVVREGLGRQVVDRHAGNKIQYFIKTHVTHTQRVLTARARERETGRETGREMEMATLPKPQPACCCFYHTQRQLVNAQIRFRVISTAILCHTSSPLPLPLIPSYYTRHGSPALKLSRLFQHLLPGCFPFRFPVHFGSVQLVPFYWGVLGVCDADRLFALLFIRQSRRGRCVCVCGSYSLPRIEQGMRGA